MLSAPAAASRKNRRGNTPADDARDNPDVPVQHHKSRLNVRLPLRSDDHSPVAYTHLDVYKRQTLIDLPIRYQPVSPWKAKLVRKFMK